MAENTIEIPVHSEPFDKTAVKEVIRYLADYECKPIYTLHDEFNLSPERIITALNYLSAKNLVIIKNKHIMLSRIDSISKIKFLREIFISSLRNEALLPYSNSVQKVNINEPYLPDSKLISDELKILNK